MAKTGDARVGFVGFPSVGKSTLLTNLAGVYSEVAAYEFTTLTTVPGRLKNAQLQPFSCNRMQCSPPPPPNLRPSPLPPEVMRNQQYDLTTTPVLPLSTIQSLPENCLGVIRYKGAKIQLLDLPGIIEGAKDGKGRGRQVIAGK